ncbi:cytochrome P450 [Pseudomonas sp. CBS]|uniref:cytochrome P450 n=1 Tax=Pseudomonas TaxID=286 RepID=UPI0021ACE23B|nr:MULTISPECIES: cytochrome P450 [unclassified Pseudomonas]UVH51980.1 cytochrome P450 [Pseudomonas sp. CBS]WEL64461.1 cytochrome P450 [Pseudomonas sp. CBSPGW29]WEL73643.1 cytochrome P450 [Pseudomonas sp. CBSPCGW29]WEL74955.1 cytochrome P450 [Pseudomonas sp. CBSPAW29]
MDKRDTPFDSMTLVACLQKRAAESPDDEVFTFLDSNGDSVARLSFRQLHDQACAIAAALQTHGPEGQRVLLLFEPGLAFITAFYGCLYAGAVAVPVYPPDPLRFERTLPRLLTIVADSMAAVLLTSTSILAQAKHFARFAPDLAKLQWLAVEEIIESGQANVRPSATIAATDIALIQYTSGSTSAPKGVVVSHQNLLINARMIQRVTHMDRGRVIALWVPMYHDLGLMTGVILPVVIGARALLMSPLDFLKRPVLWLSVIDRYKATDTAGPNFALDLCVQKISHDDYQDWDLSSLKFCLVGAEPVRYASVERFLHRFEAVGLSRQCMFAGYGLAEATVGVSFGSIGAIAQTAFVDVDELARNHVMELDSTHPKATPLVTCGMPLDAVTLAIVNPETCEQVGADEVGEVWVIGPQVALGYWQLEVDNARTFKARIGQGDHRDWLRTGDLGFIKDQQLYITGRIKDLLIIRGKNYYPQDIENILELCHPRVRKGAVIVFTIMQAATESLVVAAEVDLRLLSTPVQKQRAFDEITNAMVKAVSKHHGLPLHSVNLLKIRTIDKTSSGKLARQSCKQRFLERRLEVEFVWQKAKCPPNEHASLPEMQGKKVSTSKSFPERRHTLINYIETELASLVSVAQAADSTSLHLDELGLDSVQTMELMGRIERHLQVEIPVSKIFGARSVEEIADVLLQLVVSNEVSHDQRQSSVGPVQSSVRLTQALTLQALSLPAPIFCVCGLGGMPHYLLPLSNALAHARPLIFFQAVGVDGAESPLGSVEEMAQRYLQEMKAIQPSGPYVLAGHSFGGLVIYEMAQRLTEQGEQVENLLLLDTTLIKNNDLYSNREANASDRTMAMYELAGMLRRFSGKSCDEDWPKQMIALNLDEQANKLEEELGDSGAIVPGSVIDNIIETYLVSFSAMERYRPLPYAGPITLFRAQDIFPEDSLHPSRKIGTYFGDPTLGWQRLCPALRVSVVRGDHFTIALASNATELASAILCTLNESTRLEVDLNQLISARFVPTKRRAIEVSRQGVTFDQYHPEVFNNPYPIFRQLREHAPIYRDTAGVWWVTRYTDVSAGLRDKRFSVEPLNATQPGQISSDSVSPILGAASLRQDETLPVSKVYNNFMVLVDPPRHQHLRQFFSPLFEHATIKRWRAHIDREVDLLIANMRLRPEPDIVRDLALPLPIRVISKMLGTPQQDAFVLESWANDLFQGGNPVLADAIERINTSAQDFMQYIADHLGRRRRSPARDDFLSFLLEKYEGQPLSDDELAANFILLFAAGFETTASVISNSVLALMRNPDQLQLLREHPELMENAVEEFIRYEGAFRLTIRTALEDVEMGDGVIPRGDQVYFVMSAANRDPQMFADPDRLDVMRDAKRHVGFGHGIHYCLGAPLARFEIQSAIAALIRYDFAPVSGAIEWKESIMFRSMERLPIVFR